MTTHIPFDPTFGDSPYPLAGTAPVFGCWRAVQTIRQSPWMDSFRVQPVGTPNRERSDYLLKAVRSDLPAEERLRGIERLTRRMVAAESIDHHGLPPVLDAELDRPPFYLVEPYLEGQSLWQLRRRATAVCLSRVVWIARQLAEILVAAHAARQAHLGLDPEKILVDGAGKVALLGWSDGQVFGRPHRPGRRDEIGLRCRAPECFFGDYQAQPAADAYSLGVIWYWLFSGRWPIDGPIGELRQQHASRIPTNLEVICPDLPGELARLVHRLLAKNPLRRPSLQWVLDQMFSIEIDSLHDRRPLRTHPA